MSHDVYSSSTALQPLPGPWLQSPLGRLLPKAVPCHAVLQALSRCWLHRPLSATAVPQPGCLTVQMSPL
jgi:hypothetical protein